MKRCIMRTGMMVIITGVLLTGCRQELPLPPSETAIALDGQLDWSRARLIAVQDGERYKTLDSFAREAFSEMYGKEHLPGLSPLASVFEWVFNKDKYVHEPVIRVKEAAVRHAFAKHFPAAEREYIREKGYLTPRQIMNQGVRAHIEELGSSAITIRSANRVRQAEFIAGMMEQLMLVVPAKEEALDAPWHSPKELIANLPEDLLREAGVEAQRGGPIPGYTAREAVDLTVTWASLRQGWQKGDAEAVQENLDKLAGLLPGLAPAGHYPGESQRAAEAHYYAMGKLTWGWLVYFVGAIASIWLLATGWKTPRVVAMLFLIVGLLLHAYGVSLRWYILGRIPVANMFEAVTGAAWAGVCIALLLELIYKTRVFALAGNVTGFSALIVAQYIIPGGGTLTSIRAILDDVMLRIHTTLIIFSYAFIFVAAVIALVYLFGYYRHRYPRQSTLSGVVVALLGTVLIGVSFGAFKGVAVGGPQPLWQVQLFGWLLCGTLILAIASLVWTRASGESITWAAALLVAAFAVGLGHQGFLFGLASSMLIGGLAWAGATAVGRLGPGQLQRGFAVVPAGAEGALPLQRPIMAGGAPGDEGRKDEPLPGWLHTTDWSHLIILNLVFVMLFVGIILGAVWADYSWGRPWGWDPKEVFAMNTWIIYAILIHTRFIVKRRGLWTAWLSVAGCLMMVFNWCFVNFYIVGLHSYA